MKFSDSGISVFDQFESAIPGQCNHIVCMRDGTATHFCVDHSDKTVLVFSIAETE